MGRCDRVPASFGAPNPGAESLPPIPKNAPRLQSRPQSRTGEGTGRKGGWRDHREGVFCSHGVRMQREKKATKKHVLFLSRSGRGVAPNVSQSSHQRRRHAEVVTYERPSDCDMPDIPVITYAQLLRRGSPQQSFSLLPDSDWPVALALFSFCLQILSLILGFTFFVSPVLDFSVARTLTRSRASTRLRVGWKARW